MLQFLFFTCTSLVICPVVALPGNLSELSVNSTNSTNLRTTNSTVLASNYKINPFWGLWGPEIWRCEPLYNDVLKNTTEFNKWGSSSASTIMALLPSLMAFAPVITANIGFLCTLSTTQGLIAASFTFGLPVHQLDTWNRARIRVRELLVNLEPHHEKAVTALRPFSEIADTLLAPIKDVVFLPKRRRFISVLILHFLFDVFQGFLICSLLYNVPAIDTFYLVWLCPDWGSVVFGVWLGATFSFMGWARARFERVSFGGDEVVYISKTNTSLSAFTNWTTLQEPYPMIVILRPSNNAQKREPCWTNHLYTHFFIGIFQLFWICFLSFLFSSTIGGTLLRTLTMVVSFIAHVAVSRGLSIFFCWLAQKHLDIRVIEYDCLEEKRMMQRLIGGLTGVLVAVKCFDYKKTQWQESIKMYQLGHQLSRGTVLGIPKKCTLHQGTHRDDFSSVIGITYTTCWFMILVYAYLLSLDSSGMGRVQLGAGVIITVTSAISQVHLGRTKRLSLCKCD